MFPQEPAMRFINYGKQMDRTPGPPTNPLDISLLQDSGGSSPDGHLASPRVAPYSAKHPASRRLIASHMSVTKCASHRVPEGLNTFGGGASASESEDTWSQRVAPLPLVCDGSPPRHSQIEPSHIGSPNHAPRLQTPNPYRTNRYLRHPPTRQRRASGSSATIVPKRAFHRGPCGGAVDAGMRDLASTPFARVLWHTGQCGSPSRRLRIRGPSPKTASHIHVRLNGRWGSLSDRPRLNIHIPVIRP